MSREFVAEMAAARPALFRFASALTSITAADDIVQDALTRAWAKRSQYTAERGSVQACLAIVAEQVRTGRRRPLTEHVTLDHALLAGPASDGDGPAVGKQEFDSAVSLDVGAAVGRLPERQRMAIVLSVYVDLPLADVAAVMGCSLGTVKATVHAARKSLAASLGATYALN